MVDNNGAGPPENTKPLTPPQTGWG